MKSICIVDNTARGSLWGEHGLAFLIEAEDGTQVLLDTGQSGTVLLHNLAELKIDPGQIDVVVLSHGHKDHTGGLVALLERSPGLPVYAHPNLFRGRFVRREDRKIVAVGLPLKREALAAEVELHLSAESAEIVPGVWTTGEIIHRPEPEGRSDRHLVRAGEGWAPDPYRDDMSLLLDTAQGLVLSCGCCHAGLLNTLLQVRRTFEGDIIAVTGGTHLVSADEAHLAHVVDVLRDEYGSPHLYLNHCTGEKARFALTTAFGDRVHFCPGGTVLSF